MSAPAAAQDENPWHGFYGGVNAGGAWSTSDADATLTVTGAPPAGVSGYAFTPHPSAKAEYLYEDFGSSRCTATSANGFLTFASEAHLRSHLFRAGLDCRF